MTRRAAVALAAALLALAGCSGSAAPSPSESPDGGSAADATAAPLTPQEVTEQVFASAAEVWDVVPLAESTGQVPDAGTGVEPARVEVVGVTVGPSSTELVFRLFTEAPEEVSVHATAFNQASPLTFDIRDVAIEEGALERRHLPLLGSREDVKLADSSFCVCSALPKTVDADGVLLSATYPALDPATAAVTVDVPGFEPMPDVPVTRD